MADGGRLFAEIQRQAQEAEPQLIRFLSEMVRTPSYSTEEKAVIQIIRKEMEAVGFDEVRIDGLGSVIGRLGDGPRTIAFDAHIDTVTPGNLDNWETDPFTPMVRDGRIIGRGTVDQEGGMAAMVYAAKIIKAMGLNERFTILFTGTVMEEDCDGLCWKYLIEEEGIRPELVVLTEPTSMNIYRGHRGRMEIKVRVSGVSCHGSAPERGDNAIYKIARIAMEIEKLNERLGTDPFLGKGTVTVSEVTSSSPSLCAVADGATLHLDRRLTAGETEESAVAEVQEAAELAGCPQAVVEVPMYEEQAYTGLTYPMKKYYPTWTMPEDSTWLRAAAAAYQGVFDRAPLIDKWTFSTNGVAVAGMHDIPSFGLGPGDEVQAHAPNESCPLEHLVGATAYYAALVGQLNGKGTA